MKTSNNFSQIIWVSLNLLFVFFSEMFKKHYKISSIVFSTFSTMETKPSSSTYRKRLHPSAHPTSESPGRQVQEHIISAENVTARLHARNKEQEKEEQNIKEALGESAISIRCDMLAFHWIIHIQSTFCSRKGEELWRRSVNKRGMGSTDPKYI